MSDLTLGEFTLTRVVEIEDAALVATEVFPDWDPDAVRPHLDWMVPRHFDAEAGTLAITIQSFLIKTPRHTILVDACGGNEKTRLPASLAEKS